MSIKPAGQIFVGSGSLLSVPSMVFLMYNSVPINQLFSAGVWFVVGFILIVIGSLMWVVGRADEKDNWPPLGSRPPKKKSV